MPLYKYKGYDSQSGALKKGTVEADSPKAARARLRAKEKVIVSDLKEESTGGGSNKAGKDGRSGLFSSGKVSLPELAVMTRQFSTLQGAHVPLDESLKALSAQVENPVLRSTLTAVNELVAEGKNIADACSRFPKVFNKLYINMLRAGEQSGTLGIVLERLADFQEYQVAIRGQVMSALAYPAIMIVASSAIIAYLFISVVPKLQKVFTSLKVKLPWYTELLIKMSEALQKHWIIFLGLVLASLYMFQRWRRSDRGRRIFDRWMITWPLIGAIVLRINTSKFTRTLSTLLASGVPIITALEITKNIIGNVLVAEVVDESKVVVQEGGNLGSAIGKSELFPPLVTHMIKTGEKTGQLEEMLNHVAKAYDAEVERKITSIISMIEPLMIIIMAGIVSVIIIALLIPMLSIMNNMR